MGDVLAFWLVALLVGGLALPVAFALLRRLPDGGAGLSFALGLVLAGYGYFILRTIDVLPAGRGGYVLVLGLLGLMTAAVAGRDPHFGGTLRRSSGGVAAAAGLFTLMFFAYTGFRSYQPAINGTEMPMDFMYLNATMVSPEYPPQDPWFAGERASYYYFGYLQAGVLTGAAGVAPSTGYNLGLAFTFAAAAAAIASLAAALGRWVLDRRGRRWVPVAGGLAVLLLLGVGSLSAIFELLATHGQFDRGVYEAFGVDWLLPCEAGQTAACGDAIVKSAHWYPDMPFGFWWRGTRIIPDTITEFPFFSFLLGDLHPHVMAIPLTLLAAAIACATWRGRSLLDWRRLRARPAEGAVLAVVFGALAFQNAWDAITFSLLLGGAVFVRNARRVGLIRGLGPSATYLAPLAAAAVLAYLPWYRDFNSQADGLYPYIRQGTRLPHAFLQFGPLVVAGALVVTFLGRRAARSAGPAAVFAVWVPALPLFAWVAFTGARGELNEALDARGSSGWFTLAVYCVILWALVTTFLVLVERRSPAAPVAGVASVALLLLLGTELFLIRDVFFGGLPRQNTVFKLTYQAWTLLSVAGAVALACVLREAARGRAWAPVAALPAGVLVAAGLVYPVLAVPNRTEGFGTPTAVDGLATVSRFDPAEYALARWVAANVDPGERVVEASGRRWGKDANGAVRLVDAGTDYSDSGRVSARTGRQAPIGWYFHEIQWRGDTTENHARLTRRQELADQVYLSPAADGGLAALRELGARYVVVGHVERARFAGGLIGPLETYLDVVFERGDIRVYRVPAYRVVATS